MTSQTKISYSGKLSGKHSKRPWLLWGLVLFLLTVLVGVFMAWHNRYNLLEHKVRQVFVQSGFDVELEINTANTHEMIIKNVKLSSGGQQVFISSQIRLEYEYGKVLKGEFGRVVIHKPEFAITLDKSGKIIDDWLPKNTSGGDFIFPKSGLTVEEAVVNWHAPFGNGKTVISVDAKALNNWQLVYDSPGTVLTKDDVSIRLDLKGGAEQKLQDQMTAFGSISSNMLDTSALQMGEGSIDYHLDFTRKKLGEVDVRGWMHVDGKQVETGAYAVEAIELKLDMEAKFNADTNVFDGLSTQWSLKSENVVLKNPTYRRQISERMTSYNALQNIPIAQHFSGILPSKLATLLSGFSAHGAGGLTVNKSGYRVNLIDNFTVKTKSQTVEIAAKDGDALVYFAQENKVIFDMDVNWGGAHALRIHDLKAQGFSSNGLALQTITGLQARIQTSANWYGQKGGQDLRLAPLLMNLNYTKSNGQRDILLSGKLGYDGIVPGGMVDGLQVEGVLTAHIGQDAAREFMAGFNPKADIFMKSFTGTSGWQARDLQFTLLPTDTLMYTTGQGREMLADLQNLQAQIISPAQDRRMEVNAGNVNVQTNINGFPRIWNLDVTDAVLRSDDFPSPGTHIRSKSSQLILRQTNNGDLFFNSKNPDTFIETDNVLVEGIDVKMNGVPEKFNAIYSAKKVVFKGGDVPALPVMGTATFDSGLLTGEAKAKLQTRQSGDEDTPIDISFISKEGRGKLAINIEAMSFTPNGLQPQFLIPSLKGKVAEVSGQVSAQFDLEFAGGEPIRSYGTTNLIDLDMGTLVGPIRGVNSQLRFRSLFPLKTDGVQNASLSGFDPGFPLENGRILFEIFPEGVRIDEAIWPIENNLGIGSDDGYVYIEPMMWQFGNVENLASVKIENLELETLFEEVGRDKLSVSGKVSGVLPAKINGVDVQIEGGRLEVKDGGVIKFKAASASAGAASSQNEYAGHGLKALENLTYKKMEALINGPLDGSVKLNIVAEGYNPEVLSGQTFLFDVGVEGELANIVRNLSKSFKSQENIKRVLDLQTEVPN